VASVLTEQYPSVLELGSTAEEALQGLPVPTQLRLCRSLWALIGRSR
jgi:hypothetical protein